MRSAADRCCKCDELTGRAGKGDDSIYAEDGEGPFCVRCHREYCENQGYDSPAAVKLAAAVREAEAENVRLREALANVLAEWRSCWENGIESHPDNHEAVDVARTILAEAEGGK